MLLFLSTKKTKLLIIKDILDKIVTFSLYKVNININIVFIIIFAGFIYILYYTPIKEVVGVTVR